MGLIKRKGSKVKDRKQVRGLKFNYCKCEESQSSYPRLIKKELELPAVGRSVPSVRVCFIIFSPVLGKQWEGFV